MFQTQLWFQELDPAMSFAFGSVPVGEEFDLVSCVDCSFMGRTFPVCLFVRDGRQSGVIDSVSVEPVFQYMPMPEGYEAMLGNRNA